MSSSNSDSRNAAAEPEPVAAFSVTAQPSPGVMPRVLELFAKRGFVPTQWQSTVNGAELAIDIRMQGMEQSLRTISAAACGRSIWSTGCWWSTTPRHRWNARPTALDRTARGGYPDAVMAFLDHIRAINNFDPGAFRPFVVGDGRAGYIRHDFADTLRRWPDVFQVSGDAVRLDSRLDSFEARSDAVAGPIRTLADEGVFTGWRGEIYPVKPDWHTPPSMQLERAAAPSFGIRAFGVHLNGYVRKADGLHMWVARRARDKATFPGQLDNMVAGGQPIGISLHDNMVKGMRRGSRRPRRHRADCDFRGDDQLYASAARGLQTRSDVLLRPGSPESFTPTPVAARSSPFTSGRSRRSPGSSATAPSSSSTAIWW